MGGKKNVEEKQPVFEVSMGKMERKKMARRQKGKG